VRWQVAGEGKREVRLFREGQHGEARVAAEDAEQGERGIRLLRDMFARTAGSVEGEHYCDAFCPGGEVVDLNWLAAVAQQEVRCCEICDAPSAGIGDKDRNSDEIGSDAQYFLVVGVVCAQTRGLSSKLKKSGIRESRKIA
jgi:hypothetical protein